MMVGCRVGCTLWSQCAPQINFYTSRCCLIKKIKFRGVSFTMGFQKWMKKIIAQLFSELQPICHMIFISDFAYISGMHAKSELKITWQIGCNSENSWAMIFFIHFWKPIVKLTPHPNFSSDNILRSKMDLGGGILWSHGVPHPSPSIFDLKMLSDEKNRGVSFTIHPFRDQAGQFWWIKHPLWSSTEIPCRLIPQIGRFLPDPIAERVNWFSKMNENNHNSPIFWVTTYLSHDFFFRFCLYIRIASKIWNKNHVTDRM